MLSGHEVYNVFDRSHRVDLYGRNENAQFSATFFRGGWGLNGDFQTFLDFEKTIDEIGKIGTIPQAYLFLMSLTLSDRLFAAKPS